MRTALVTLVRLVWGVVLGLSITPRLVVALAFLVMTLDLVCSLVALGLAVVALSLAFLVIALGLVAVALGLAAVALSLACLATIALSLAVDEALRLTAIALTMATTNHLRCCPPINNARVDESLRALLL